MDKSVGKLGFGMMRLPRKGEGIDIEETKRMVDAFMVSRFNYFDTAFAYPGSEEAIKEALMAHGFGNRVGAGSAGRGGRR